MSKYQATIIKIACLPVDEHRHSHKHTSLTIDCIKEGTGIACFSRFPLAKEKTGSAVVDPWIDNSIWDWLLVMGHIGHSQNDFFLVPPRLLLFGITTSRRESRRRGITIYGDTIHFSYVPHCCISQRARIYKCAFQLFSTAYMNSMSR